MSRIYAIILSLGIFVMSVDQWTKHKALEVLQTEGQSEPFWSWWQFTLVHNYGAAFGMMKSVPESIRTGFFLLMPLTILVILWWSYVRMFKKEERLGPIAIGLVFGGALGNMVDRINYGYVIDFIDWFYPSSGKCIPLFFPMHPENTCHWPVFNIADSAITLAMVLLIIHSFLQNKKMQSEANAKSKETAVK
jgi:signal peptidase II